MALQALNIEVRRGETVNLPIRIESDTIVYKPITAIAQSAPVRLTAALHGLTDGWRAAVMNVKGMTEMNVSQPLRDSSLRRVSVVDPNTIEFNEINGAGFRAYVSGGQLVYYAPIDLSGFTSARMDIKDKVGGAVLASLSTTAGTLELSVSDRALWIRLTDEATALWAFKSAVFDIELVDALGGVLAVCAASSVLTVLPEVTTAV